MSIIGDNVTWLCIRRVFVNRGGPTILSPSSGLGGEQRHFETIVIDPLLHNIKWKL